MMRRQLLVCVAACWSAFAGIAMAETKIEFWHSMGGEKGKLLEGFVREFNARPEVKGHFVVHAQFVGTYEEGLNQLRAGLMAGHTPHIAQVYDIGTGLMVDSGAVRPLADFIAGDPDFPLAALVPQVLGYYTVNGSLYALPFATSNPILYYNAGAFAKAGITEPPKTFEELAVDAGKLSDGEHTGLTWPLTGWLFEQFMARNGVPLVDHDNGRAGAPEHVNYQDPVGLAFLSAMVDMEQKGHFANLGRAWDPAEFNFLAGRSAMLITSTSDVNIVTKNAPFTVKTAPFPVLASRQGVPGGTIVGGNALWIMRGRPENEQRMAYQFLKFLTQASVQRPWHLGTGYFPIRRDMIDTLTQEGVFIRQPNARVAIDQMLASPAIPATQGALMGVFAEARDHIETAMEEALAGVKTPEAALKKAARRSNQALARYNRLRNQDTHRNLN